MFVWESDRKSSFWADGLFSWVIYQIHLLTLNVILNKQRPDVIQGWSSGGQEAHHVIALVGFLLWWMSCCGSQPDFSLIRFTVNCWAQICSTLNIQLWRIMTELKTSTSANNHPSLRSLLLRRSVTVGRDLWSERRWNMFLFIPTDLCIDSSENDSFILQLHESDFYSHSSWKQEPLGLTRLATTPQLLHHLWLGVSRSHDAECRI